MLKGPISAELFVFLFLVLIDRQVCIVCSLSMGESHTQIRGLTVSPLGYGVAYIMLYLVISLL